MIQPRLINLNEKPLRKLYRDVGYWFQKTFRPKSLYKRAAIHESSHIVMSYFYSYTVSHAQLLTDQPGNGLTRIEYGSKAAAANFIFGQQSAQFHVQPASTKKNIHITSFNLMVVLYAGSVGEAFVKGKGKDGNYNLVVSGEDLSAISDIEHFLQAIERPVEEGLVAMKTFELFEQFPILKECVRKLAASFLASPNYTLSQQDIEAVLTETGFFEFLEELMNR